MWPRKRPRSAAPAPAVRKWRAALEEEEEYDLDISNDEASSEASAGDSARVADAEMPAAAQVHTADEQEDSPARPPFFCAVACLGAPFPNQSRYERHSHPSQGAIKHNSATL